jgi:hypothetical protein
MNEPAITEALKTDVPSPKPNRRKRLALRFAVLVVAVSALGAAYWFTRPPELVLWTSPPIARSGRHISVLVPRGWKISKTVHEGLESHGEWGTYYSISASLQRPQILMWRLPFEQDQWSIQINVMESHGKTPRFSELYNGVYRLDNEGRPHRAHNQVAFPSVNSWAGVIYERSNLPAFNRTYRQICNSLTIE